MGSHLQIKSASQILNLRHKITQLSYKMSMLCYWYEPTSHSLRSGDTIALLKISNARSLHNHSTRRDYCSEYRILLISSQKLCPVDHVFPGISSTGDTEREKKAQKVVSYVNSYCGPP